MSLDTENIKNTNIAETLARVLPNASVIDTPLRDIGIYHVAVPKNFDLKEIDGEALGAGPRRITAQAVMGDAESFIAYVHRHANPGSVVWCNFNPQTFALSFTAVIDEHAKGEPAWRDNVATYTPLMSAEWRAWTGQNKKPMDQVPFAEFLEQNERDIVSLEGFPTSLQMMAMATEFEARQDMRVKSMVKLQSGGVRMEYINDADAGTTEHMKLFDKFVIGIPVFWSPPSEDAVVAYPITARLRYRLASGKLAFWYDLVRADLVHEKAAHALLATIRAELGNTPLLLGSCG